MPRPADRSIAVVIPSRLAGTARKLFVEQAIGAAAAQAIPARLPSRLFHRHRSRCADSHPRLAHVPMSPSRGAAGAGRRRRSTRPQMPPHRKITISSPCLKTTIKWEPNFLAWALACLETCDFVSSNQLEVDAEERCVRVNDFPTPSGWIMAADLWRKVGPFDESLRWHVDNDWLGRLALSGARRVHLVEATAPINLPSSAQVRPWIANVLTQGGPMSTVRRHLSSRPLVRRTVHQGSGMHQIASNPLAAAESQSEYRQLIARYGRIPW